MSKTTVRDVVIILAHSPEQFKALMPSILENWEVFVQHFRKDLSHLAVPAENEACVKILSSIFDILKKNKDGIDLIKNFAEVYYSEHIMNSYIKDHNSQVTNAFRNLFEYYKTPKNWVEGYNFFTTFNIRIIDIKFFVNTFAYELYFSYQLQRFSSVERFLNYHSTEMITNKYAEASDYCLFNYYRGLIFLARRQYYEAAVAFSVNFLIGSKSMPVYTPMHLESMKRLILLSAFNDSIMRSVITPVIKTHSILLKIKPLDAYEKFYNAFNARATTCKEAEELITDNNSKLKVEKTRGLAKLAVKHFIFEKINKGLRAFKIVKIDKICKLLDVGRESFITNLRYFAPQNLISVQIDEIDDTVEVLDEEFDAQVQLTELKSVYKKLNSMQNELIDVNFKQQEESLEATLGLHNKMLKRRFEMGMGEMGMDTAELLDEYPK